MPVTYRFRRNSALAIAAVCFSIALIGAAEAAGAFAVGVCGAYGYGFDFRNVTEARAAAIKKCTGGTCKVVGDMRKGCAAIAIDAKNPCGSFGWAIESHLGRAENTSMRRCSEFGGHECVVRAWACDEKG
jgi:Domain of unknown function (DUF4189)